MLYKTTFGALSFWRFGVERPNILSKLDLNTDPQYTNKSRQDGEKQKIVILCSQTGKRNKYGDPITTQVHLHGPGMRVRFTLSAQGIHNHTVLVNM